MLPYLDPGLRIALVCLTLTLPLSAWAASPTPPDPHDIPHFAEVDAGVYRGGQPTPAGWHYLKQLGVETVVKLDLAGEGSDADAEALGMHVVDASGPPSDLSNFWSAPDRAHLKLAVDTLSNTQHPVYVHCLHGQDRTGLVVAMYRVQHDGYTPKAAYHEMRQHGFHRVFVGLLDAWHDFLGEREDMAKGVMSPPLL